MRSEMGCDNVCTAPGKTLKETCSSSLPVGALNAATLGAHSSSITVFSARMFLFLLVCFLKSQRAMLCLQEDESCRQHCLIEILMVK